MYRTFRRRNYGRQMLVISVDPPDFDSLIYGNKFLSCRMQRTGKKQLVPILKKFSQVISLLYHCIP